MTSDRFWSLQKGDQLMALYESDNSIYKVLETDNRGRIKMQKVVWYIDHFDLRDEEFETYDDAMDALIELNEEDEDLGLCECDIEEREVGKPFWMHYKDVCLYY